jgi:hypothetical protein
MSEFTFLRGGQAVDAGLVAVGTYWFVSRSYA